MRNLPAKSTAMGYLLSQMGDGKIWTNKETRVALRGGSTSHHTVRNLHLYGFVEKIGAGYRIVEEAKMKLPSQQLETSQHPMRLSPYNKQETICTRYRFPKH